MRSRAAHLIRKRPLVLLLPLAALYLAQNLLMPVMTGDEVQQADYLNRIASGQLPYRDFLDIYGPLNWLPPTIVYKVLGHNWLGARLWVLLVQMLTLALGYRLVQRLGNGFYAAAYLVCMTIFWGKPIALNTSPYAYIQTFPLILGTLLLLIGQRRTTAAKCFWAGVLSAVAIFVRISSGLFLWLAGLLVCFCLVPVCTGPLVDQPDQSAAVRLKTIRIFKWLAAAAYLVVFSRFIAPHYERQYFWHLTLPLVLGLAATLWVTQRVPGKLDLQACWTVEHRRIACWLSYGAGSLLACALLLLAFYPSGVSGAYLNKLPGLISGIAYSVPFDPLGFIPESPLQRIVHAGYWTYLPWLAASGLAIFLIIRSVPGSDRCDTYRDGRMIAVFITVSLCHFVIVPVPDTGHLIQTLLLWLVCCAVLISFLEREWLTRPGSRRVFRLALVCLLTVWLVPLVHLEKRFFGLDSGHLAVVPDLGLARLHLDAVEKPLKESYFAHNLTVSAHLRTHKRPEDQCLVISDDKLVYFYGALPLYGGYSSFQFYMLSYGRFDRHVFFNQIDPADWQQLITTPPRFIVDHEHYGGENMKSPLPELADLLTTRYRQVLSAGKIILYERIR